LSGIPADEYAHLPVPGTALGNATGDVDGDTNGDAAGVGEGETAGAAEGPAERDTGAQAARRSAAPIIVRCAFMLMETHPEAVRLPGPLAPEVTHW
jgi:hypothetical protein